MKSLATIKIDPELLKPDSDCLDRYTKFSEELLRLAILAIGAVGFLITNVLLKWAPEDPNLLERLSNTKLQIIFCATSLGLAAACAMFHRYVSADGYSCHIAALRLGLRGAEKDDERQIKEIEKRNWKYKWSSAFLAFSASFLLAGMLLFSWAFITLVFFAKLKQ